MFDAILSTFFSSETSNLLKGRAGWSSFFPFMQIEIQNAHRTYVSIVLMTSLLHNV